jgi:excisionase family DNA binding protein
MLTEDQVRTISQPDYVPRRAVAIRDAANWLGVTPQTVRNLFHDRDLEGYVVGRKILIYADSLETFRVRSSNRPDDAEAPRPPRQSAILPPPRASTPRRSSRLPRSVEFPLLGV